MDEETAWEILVPHEGIRQLIHSATKAVSDLVIKQGWPKRIVDDVASLHFAAALPPYAHLEIAHPGLLIPYDKDMPGPFLLKSGYLMIGFCPNGDFIAVDCKKVVGSIVYICHEEFDYNSPEIEQSIIRCVSPSVAEYLLALLQEDTPMDFFDE